MFKYKEFVNHSLTFYAEGMEGRHTWDDWKLVPTSRPVIAAPAPKYNFIEIPGTEQEIDLTEALTTRVNFSPREGSLEFLVVNKAHWAAVYEEVMNYLAGKRCRMVLDDEKEYYYQGRCYVSDWKSDQANSILTIGYHFDPRKVEVTDGLDFWAFDLSNNPKGTLL